MWQGYAILFIRRGLYSICEFPGKATATKNVIFVWRIENVRYDIKGGLVSSFILLAELDEAHQMRCCWRWCCR
jgi:hypothetical protein